MSPKKPSILVVDDDADIRSNLTDILKDGGYETASAGSGEEALALMSDRSFDVALLDLKMPGMGGLELYQHIKKAHTGTVAIVVTAYADEKTTQEALRAGAWKLLPKPVDFELLLSLIGLVMEQPLAIVVDDDPALCQTLWDLLREQGLRVCVAHDLEMVKELLKDRLYQLALIDMKLPAGDGTDVLRLLRRDNPQVRTILITGHRGEMAEKINQAIAAGADAVCYKPFEVDQLLAIVRRLTKKP